MPYAGNGRQRGLAPQGLPLLFSARPQARSFGARAIAARMKITRADAGPGAMAEDPERPGRAAEQSQLRIVRRSPATAGFNWQRIDPRSPERVYTQLVGQQASSLDRGRPDRSGRAPSNARRPAPQAGCE